MSELQWMLLGIMDSSAYGAGAFDFAFHSSFQTISAPLRI